MKSKKKEKSKKTALAPISGIMGMGTDYHQYRLTVSDRFVSALLGVGAGIVVGYVFFSSWLVAAVLGVGAAVFLQEPYRKYLKERRLKKLLLEFKDLLEALSSSYSAGLTTTRAFADACDEMKGLYGEDADIVEELHIINVGLQHNQTIEDLLLNFADRCGLDDVNSFANVFEVCNRKSGNIQQIVSETRSVINDKIEIEMEIQTMVAAGKNELNIMMVMPLIIMVSMRGFGETMAGNSLTNVIVKIVALGLFGAAYALGNKLVRIKL